MKFPRRHFIRIASSCVLGASLVLPGLAAAQAAGGEPFRIGVVLPKTGPYSQYGDFTEQGILVGIDQINAAGGILGRKVEAIIRDDASNPGRSLLAAKELLSEQKVDFLYPEIISGLALAVLPYASEQRVFTISNGATPQIGDAQKYPYSFSLSDLAPMRIPAMAAALTKLGGKRVGILVSTNPPQVALGDGLHANLQARYGLEVVGYEKFGIKSTDYTPQLQALKDAGADIIAFDSTAREGVRNVMTSMQTLGWNAKVVGLPAMLYGDLTEQIPASVQGQFYAVNYRVGTRGAAPMTPEMTQTLEAMKKIRPIQNLAVAAIARDTMWLAKWAYETAQKESGNTSAESLSKAMESVGARDYPKEYALVFANPGYKPGLHTTVAADYSKLWGLVRVSKPVDGTYEGEALELLVER